jgi:cobaltochelatase CobN
MEALLDQYHKARTMGETGRLEIIGRQVAPLLVDCGLAETVPTIDALPGAVTIARRQIEKIKRCLMPEGMHLLSVPPGKTGTARILAAILQAPPPGLPDLETIAAWSNDPSPSVYEGATSVIERLIAAQPVKAPEAQRIALTDYCRVVADRIARCNCEIGQLLQGLDGKFIPPGLSGSLSRGTIDALPTGRNFFATDVTCLPTRAAWNIGQQMADKLLLKYLEDEQRFPESIGISIWSSDAYKSDGELLCQILALMGARPVWDRQGRAHNTTPIDLEELLLALPDGSLKKHPRVDVTIQTSSIMRDLVPNFCDLLDRTVVMLSRLDEPDEWNFIRKHTRQQMDQLSEQTREEISDSRLRRMATLRIFSSAPGTYGLGVGLALDASAWQDKKDLAEVYINWGGHAYGADDGDHSLAYGEKVQQLLADQLARIDVAYMKQASAEYDVLDCGCYAVFQGGMAAAASAVGRKSPKLYWGDSTLPTDADVGDLADEIQRSARAKLLNPAWIEHMRRHGYQGAQAAASRVNNLFKWSATSEQVPKRLFDDVVRTYVLDEKNRTWLRESNPYALEEITRRLLEAASRGLWDAEEASLAEVRSAALEIEGDMEEIMGDVDGEFQGGKVDVLTAADVEKWDMGWRIGDR